MFRILYLLYQLIRFAGSLAWQLLAEMWTRAAADTSRSDPGAPSAASLRDGHELSDARPVLVAVVAAGLFIMIGVTMAALGWMKGRLDAHHSAAMPVPASMESFENGPSTHTSIEDDWKSIDAETRQHLEDYGWADAAHSAIRIPIQRAMSLIATEGLPARPGQSTPPFPAPDQEKLPLIDLETKTHATQHGED
jgi:hypothetical protein